MTGSGRRMESARQKGPAHCVRRNPSHNWLFMVDFFGFGAIFGGFIHILGVFRRISSPVHSAAQTPCVAPTGEPRRLTGAQIARTNNHRSNSKVFSRVKWDRRGHTSPSPERTSTVASAVSVPIPSPPPEGHGLAPCDKYESCCSSVKDEGRGDVYSQA